MTRTQAAIIITLAAAVVIAAWLGWREIAGALGLVAVSAAARRRPPPAPAPPAGDVARVMAEAERAEVDNAAERDNRTDARIIDAADAAQPAPPGAPVRSRFLDRLRKRGGALAIIALWQPCPDAGEVAALREQHAQMDAAGVACLDALDVARAERDRCAVQAAGKLDALAVAMDAQAAALRAAHEAERPAVRPWVFVAVGGVVAGVAAIGAHAADMEAEGMAIATAGAVAGATLLALAYSWAGLE